MLSYNTTADMTMWKKKNLDLLAQIKDISCGKIIYAYDYITPSMGGRNWGNRKVGVNVAAAALPSCSSHNLYKKVTTFTKSNSFEQKVTVLIKKSQF